MTRIFYETLLQVVLVAVFGERIFRWCAARMNSWLDAPKPPKKPPMSEREKYDEWEWKQQ